MIEKLKDSKLLFWTVELLLLATFVFVLTKIGFLFSPIGTFFSTIFSPILISGFLYFILNPIVTFMEKRVKIPRVLGILIVFLLFVAMLVFASINFIPSLIGQITDLAQSVPQLVKDIQHWAIGLEKYKMLKHVDIESYVSKLDFSWGDLAKNTLNGVANSLGSVFNVVAQTALLIGTVPFVLFYMLKDGEKIPPVITKVFPIAHRENVLDLLHQMNKTIATYISGQAIECLFVFCMMFIGYLILGLPYAFLFAVIAGLCNLIPYLGPWLGLAPAFLATVFQNPVKGLLIIIIVAVVQQLDGTFIYPNVIGKTLKIHPVAIVFVLLTAGNIAGLLGIFLGVPLYAIAKTVIHFLISLYHVKKEESDANRTLEDVIEENAQVNEEQTFLH